MFNRFICHFLGSLVLLTTGCVTNRQLMKQSPNQMATFSPMHLNGPYSNLPVSDSTHENLWSILYTCHSLKTDSTVLTPTTRIDLQVTERVLTVTALEDSVIVNRFELVGRINGDYFVVKRKLLLIPIPFLFYWHSEHKAIIGTSEEGQLVVKYGAEEFRWILMAAGYEYRSHDEFERLH